MASSLVSLSNELASLVESSAAPVVAVHGRPRFNSSGVHWSPGIVVTAEHTLRHDDDIVVRTGAGDELRAEIAGRDPGTDLAVLRIKDLTIPTAPKSEDSRHRPGDLIVAVGRNKNSANAALGVISSLGAASQTWRGGKLDQVIRLDIALHPVASGGAVVDSSGKLIGIATPILSRAAVFAVPNATVERVVQALLAHGRLPQGYLGAGLQPIRLPEHLTKGLGLAIGGGLMTVSVDQNAPAGKAGLMIGDVLFELNNQFVDRPEAVRPLLAESVGKTISARILRGGKLVNLEIAVAERPGRN
ncbi:MAG TPA: S1C family serine protease [Bryobacteraceae bacterium]|nr:S1C family serine protease [Bryobacteraceae bacterium]